MHSLGIISTFSLRFDPYFQFIPGIAIHNRVPELNQTQNKPNNDNKPGTCVFGCSVLDIYIVENGHV